MGDTGDRDQNLTCVSEGFSMVGNLVLASEDYFFTHSLSQEASKREMSRPSLSSVCSMVLTAAGLQVNKYSRTRK